MKEIRLVKVNETDVPVVISDEKEALLAAKAAGRAIVGLWRPGTDISGLSPAGYVAEEMTAVTDKLLERVARRHMGLPWNICETRRLLIREMFGDDFDEVWDNRIGRGFGTVEELLSYTNHQYSFYEFGFWALIHKESGEMVGVAGLKVPEDGDEKEGTGTLMRRSTLLKDGTEEEDGCVLELGYHIFPGFRRQGYAKESCEAILQYGEEELKASGFLVRIANDNLPSRKLAVSLGFEPVRTV